MNKKPLIGMALVALVLLGLVVYAAARPKDDAAEPSASQPASAAIASQPTPVHQETNAAPQQASAADAPANTAPVAMKTFKWDEFGVTFTLPENWDWFANNPQFDLALISPEVNQYGNGAYITIKAYPSLGPDTTPESALQPVADETGAEVQPFPGGGIGVTLPDEANGIVRNIVIYPYNDMGATLVLQTTASPDENQTILDILGSMKIHPPQPDSQAADAAFLAGIEANGVPSYGNADAPVVMREYLSFTCGHCAQYTLAMNNLLALDVESGRVRFELSPVSWDDKAQYAALAFYCAAAQSKGYSAYKALYYNYLALGYEEAYTEDAIHEAFGEDGIGLDMEAFDQCMADGTYADLLDQSNTSFADYGLSGTPTVLLGFSDEELTPLHQPDQTVWSGTIPINVLRQIVNSMIDDGMTPDEAAKAFFGEN